jgi:penicillin-binding protein 2
MIQRPDHVPNIVRLKGMFAVVVLMMSIIVARLWYLQIAMGTSFAEDAEKQRIRPIRRLAARGVITDSKGRVLATSRPQYVVTVLPEETKKNPRAITTLASILNVTPESILEKLTDPEPRANLARASHPGHKVPIIKGPHWKLNATEPIKVAEKVDLKIVTQIEEQKLDLDGVEVSREPVRYYMDDKLCSHILGRTYPIPPDRLRDYKARGYHDNDIVGAEGLEKTYEATLRGTDGTLLVAVDARNRMLRRTSESSPLPGNTLKLCLDLDLQKAAYRALQDTLSQGHPGSAVALDPNTGAVLAMVSTPSYDLNGYSKQFKSLSRDSMKPLYNRATRGAYACGSTFKLITAAAGLEMGSITPQSSIYCPGSLRVGNRTFKCDGFHGNIGFETALGKSCDVYFYNVGLRVDQPGLEQMAKRFGLGERTGIDLPGELKGAIPSPQYKRRHHLDRWQRGDTVNMAIGQGYVQVTPLQLADFTAALANGGTLWRPQLVKEIRDAGGGLVHSLAPEKRGELGLKQENLNAIVRGMRRVVQNGGTAPNVAIPGLDIAAKTGTAQTGSGGDNSVFVCFAPLDHPKIAIAVLIEKVGHGNEFAGPVARQMLLQYFRHPKESEKQQVQAPQKAHRG